MLAAFRHPLRTQEIELGARLNGLERDWILCCLLARRGVVDASYRELGLGQLVIEYDPAVISEDEIRIFVGACNLADGGPLV